MVWLAPRRIGQRGFLGFGRRPGARQFLQRFDGFGRGGERAGLEGLAHQRQYARVEPIGLGELTDGLGEQTRRNSFSPASRQASGDAAVGAHDLP